jgi:hypothetical protein
MNGTVFIGHLVLGEDGEEVEAFEAVPCCRCSDEAKNRRGLGLKAGTLSPRGGGYDQPSNSKNHSFEGGGSPPHSL